MPGYWNYYGDHLTTFGSAAVNSSWIDDEPVTEPGEDPLLGARIVFNAKLVDLDPADTFTSQLISARFSVVGRDRDGQLAELISGLPTTSHTRWLNFSRPGGAGTFQSVIPNDQLAFIDESLAPDSRGLAALRAGAAAGGGLSLRYCLYAMKAGFDEKAQYDAFKAGKMQMNPKIGRVLGTIGVWNGTDMISVPVGRLLHIPAPPFFPSAAATAAAAKGARRRVKSHEDVEKVAPAVADGTPADEYASMMGPAAAVILGDRVVLDLLTTFPEQGARAKHDFGKVDLVLEYSDPSGAEQQAVVGNVAYDADVYELLAGVVELPIPSELAPHVAEGSLFLRDAAGTVLLREIEAPQIETDDRNVYIDIAPEGSGTAATAKMTLHAFKKGEPSAEPVTVKLEVYEDVMNPGTANSTDPLVVSACVMVNQQQGLEGAFTIPAGGSGDLVFSVSKPGLYKLRFLPPHLHGVSEKNPNFAVEFFGNYRVYPADDFSEVAEEDITWPFVWENVFSYYAILYPIMSTIIPWAPENSRELDPERVTQFALAIRQAVDESRVGTALAMPITRDLSAGKRKLVQRWCDLQLRETP